MTKPIPEGYHSVTPYLIVDDAKSAIDFYTRAFGAEEVPAADGRQDRPCRDQDRRQLRDARRRISGHGTSRAEEPRRDDGQPRGLCSGRRHRLPEGDHGGAKELKPLQDQFWGDRMGTLTDPFGHQWSLATRVQDVAPEEMEQRMQEFSKSQKQAEPA